MSPVHWQMEFFKSRDLSASSSIFSLTLFRFLALAPFFTGAKQENPYLSLYFAPKTNGKRLLCRLQMQTRFLLINMVHLSHIMRLTENLPGIK